MPDNKPIKDHQVLILFDKPLLDRLDAQAKRFGMSRGALVRMICTQYVEGQESGFKYPASTSTGIKLAAEPTARYNAKAPKSRVS